MNARIYLLLCVPINTCTSIFMQYILDAVQVNLLCGQCKQGYSLAEGTLHCIQCPKHWPASVVANILEAIVGDILLVLFFLILNLTVALGTVNGIIFYANVVYVNRNLFLPFPNTNFFTFFINVY